MTRTVSGSAQAPRGGRLPDFLLVGAPKAGTTALHAALAQHPELFLSPRQGAEVLPVRRLPAAGVPGARRRPQQPGVDLAAAALPRPVRRAPATTSRPARARRSTSTTATPGAGSPPTCRAAKLVAVLRDPVDRAYSNWMHLWADGLEPCADVVEAVRAGGGSASTTGWAPFWHYRGARHVRPPAGRPLRALPARAGAAAALPELVDDPHADAEPGRAASSASRRTWSPRSRRATPGRSCTRACAPSCSGRWCGPARPPGSSCRRRPGGRSSRPLIAQLHQRGNPARPRLDPGAARRPARAVPRGHRRCSRRSPGSRSTTGARTATATRSTPASRSADQR